MSVKSYLTFIMHQIMMRVKITLNHLISLLIKPSAALTPFIDAKTIKTYVAKLNPIVLYLINSFELPQ